jgi:hypothetical protein
MSDPISGKVRTIRRRVERLAGGQFVKFGRDYVNVIGNAFNAWDAARQFLRHLFQKVTWHAPAEDHHPVVVPAFDVT